MLLSTLDVAESPRTQGVEGTGEGTGSTLGAPGEPWPAENHEPAGRMKVVLSAHSANEPLGDLFKISPEEIAGDIDIEVDGIDVDLESKSHREKSQGRPEHIPPDLAAAIGGMVSQRLGPASDPDGPASGQPAGSGTGAPGGTGGGGAEATGAGDGGPVAVGSTGAGAGTADELGSTEADGVGGGKSDDRANPRTIRTSEARGSDGAAAGSAGSAEPDPGTRTLTAAPRSATEQAALAALNMIAVTLAAAGIAGPPLAGRWERRAGMAGAGVEAQPEVNVRRTLALSRGDDQRMRMPGREWTP